MCPTLLLAQAGGRSVDGRAVIGGVLMHPRRPGLGGRAVSGYLVRRSWVGRPLRGHRSRIRIGPVLYSRGRFAVPGSSVAGGASPPRESTSPICILRQLVDSASRNRAASNHAAYPACVGLGHGMSRRAGVCNLQLRDHRSHSLRLRPQSGVPSGPSPRPATRTSSSTARRSPPMTG